MGIRSYPRIAIYISFSGEGGVERMMINLTAGLVALGCQVDLIPIRKSSPFLRYLPSEVRVISLRSSHTRTSLPGLIRYLRTEEPDGILAAKDRASQIAVLARRLSGVKSRLVLRIGTNVSASLAHRASALANLRVRLMRLTYPMADAIVAVSQGVASDLRGLLKINPERIHVIPNPVITPELNRLAEDPVDHPWFHEPGCPIIIGMGRLTLQKDFITLLKAFALVSRRRRCRLVILGEGRDRRYLEALSKELGISKQVNFPGFVANPYAYLKRSSVFVLSSLWEGSPNALCEALALGVPVVATDCPSGPREILRGWLARYLVPPGKPAEMAEAIEEILKDPPPATVLREAAGAFTMEASSRRYLELLTGPELA